MNIAEMHVWFRQYAQQMGMQNVRAILPEQIDVLINTSISDVVNQLVRENVGVRNDRIVTDNVKLNQINALRSLYKVKELPMSDANPFMEFIANNRLTGKMSNKKVDGTNVTDDLLPNYLFLVDFSLNYKVTSTGYAGVTGGAAPSFSGNEKQGIETNWFPVRIIDDAFLADTLNDSILKNRIRTPIIVTYGMEGDHANDDTFDLYVDLFREREVSSNTYYVLENNLVPYKLRMSYVAKPASVKYAADISGTNVDCDLPESMHVDILKHAVDLYNTSINGGLYNAQQNQQAQQREMSRNEARPANEGYQN